MRRSRLSATFAARMGRQTTVAGLFFLYAIAGQAQQSGEAALKEQQRRLNRATVQPFIDYCQKAAPGTSEAVNSGLANYEARMTETLDLRRASANSMSAVSPEEEAAMKRDIVEAFRPALEKIKEIDAKQYCAWFAGRLQSATRETITKSLDEYDARVRAARSTQPAR